MQYRKLKDLKKLKENPRFIRDEKFKNLCKSIKDNPGYFEARPLILSDRTGDLVIIAGNQRYEAAKAGKLKEAPTFLMEDLTEEKEREITIRDNAHDGEWDMDMLSSWDDLPLAEWGVDIPDEWGSSNDKPGLTDDDAVPEVPEEPITKPGDLWLLGENRVLCGDATKQEDVERLMGGEKPMLMVTDPPYGVEYDANWRNEADRANGKPYGARAIGKVNNDNKADWRDAWAGFPGNVVYSWHPAGATSLVHGLALQESGFDIRMVIIWAKNQFPIGRGHYHVKHEPCFYAVRSGCNADWAGDRKQTTLWEIDKPRKSETGHSTQKPVECKERPIRNHNGDVYDPFLGSGSTLIACEKTNRKCYGMEIDTHYCDVIVKRYEDYTGKKAVLEKIKKGW